MLKKFCTKSHIGMLIAGLFFMIAFFLTSYAQLQTYASPYDCGRNQVSVTMQIDADSDNVYDTYGFQYCNSDSVYKFPISAIGDISKWPPDEIPTRSLVFNDNNGIKFLETYYDNSGNILAWFQKSANNDSVYFHSGSDNYNPANYAYDSSASYIQAFPNPADQVLKIHYVVKSSNDNIQIQLLDYEGNYLATILKAPQGQGEYKVVFPTAQYTSGYYKVRYVTGGNNYFVNIEILH